MAKVIITPTISLILTLEEFAIICRSLNGELTEDEKTTALTLNSKITELAKTISDAQTKEFTSASEEATKNLDFWYERFG